MFIIFTHELIDNICMCTYVNIYFFFFQILSALGKKWHPEHFTCLECGNPIVEKTFNEKNGEPVCTNCYLYKYSAVCYSCKAPIASVCFQLMIKN